MPPPQPAAPPHTLPADGPAAVDAYIAAQPPAAQAHLRAIRALAQRLAPLGEERLSYRMPSLFCGGVLVHYGAFKRHIGLYPPVADAALQPLLSRHLGPKGNLQLPLNQPLPMDLIERVLRARLALNQAKAPASKRAARGP